MMSKLVEMYNDLYIQSEEALREYIQEYADKMGVSFDCALKFIKKFYIVKYEMEERDGKFYFIVESEPKPVEMLLSEDYDIGIECEKEFMRG